MTEAVSEAEPKERAPVKYRSVSQVKQYKDCPHQYYLQRRVRAWQRPAAWLPQGTAVHAAVEAVEKSSRTMTLEEAQKAFSDAYAASVAELAEKTPNFQFWFWSGPYNGAADLERRYGLGMAQVEKYFAYMAKYPDRRPDVLADLRADEEEPRTALAVELPFKVKFGDVEVRGFIDQVVDEEPIDVKTGNKPGDDFQLGTYAGALEQQYGIKPTRGAFWMGRTGKLTVPYDLTDWSQQRLADEYGHVDALILAEEFDPKPEPSKCRFCSVSSSCEFSLA